MFHSSHDFLAPNLSTPDEALLGQVQHQTFRYFWEGGHPASGLARDRQKTMGERSNDLISIGGSGFGVMAIIVAVERGWIKHSEAMGRLDAMLACLERSPRYHGMFSHFIHGVTGDTIPFARKDDGGDLVETSLLLQGLLCARQYFNADATAERVLRERIDRLWLETEWDWYTKGGEEQLYWHWSPRHGWAMNRPVRGWDESLIAYVLAAASPTHSVSAETYHRGFAAGASHRNGRHYHDIELPLGMPYGGPLFIAHYSFCGLDPRGLKDRYADYWQQNVSHARIHHEHCRRNPHGHAGYGADCWGLTASHGPDGYVAYAPDRDHGVIAPSAALASFPYTPEESMRALRYFQTKPARRIWGRYGFVDSFSEGRNWHARTYLAVNQGPTICMIENYRSRLLWNLFMSAPEVRSGLMILGFSSPHLDTISQVKPRGGGYATV
ncbi:MAG: glucoamylase family protein [Phyllobacterium sp.]